MVCVPPPHCRTDLTPNFVRLLRDSEAEVRVAAAAKVAALSGYLTPQLIVQHVVPCVRELCVDSSQVGARLVCVCLSVYVRACVRARARACVHG